MAGNEDIFSTNTLYAWITFKIFKRVGPLNISKNHLPNQCYPHSKMRSEHSTEREL